MTEKAKTLGWVIKYEDKRKIHKSIHWKPIFLTWFLAFNLFLKSVIAETFHKSAVTEFYDTVSKRVTSSSIMTRPGTQFIAQYWVPECYQIPSFSTVILCTLLFIQMTVCEWLELYRHAVHRKFTYPDINSGTYCYLWNEEAKNFKFNV